jgi:hypothetical protein
MRRRRGVPQPQPQEYGSGNGERQVLADAERQCFVQLTHTTGKVESLPIVSRTAPLQDAHHASDEGLAVPRRDARYP